MFKDFKEDLILMLPMIIFIVAFIILLSLCVHEFKREELTEEDYFNKFCTKYYDISCDKIKIK